MRLLFVKQSLVWPRTSGHDVYCYHMMKGLSQLGAQVSLLTIHETQPEAIAGIPMEFCGTLAHNVPPSGGRPYRLSNLQNRFRSYWGVEHRDIAAVQAVADRVQADVVVAFGLPALPFLSGVDRSLRVWAMADEWVFHHLSLIKLRDRSTWSNLKTALVKGAYERAYRSLVDRIWVVSETDRRAARWFAGMPVADLLPNGVDTDFFAPTGTPGRRRSAAFWGRLDFEPNVDAVTWFLSDVWPAVRAKFPDATFTVAGYHPIDVVKRATAAAGVALRPNVADIREFVADHAVVALPMINGGGIKNKLLEGAAMGRSIVCTPVACRDLVPRGQLPLRQATTAADWVQALGDLWADEAERHRLGTRAREWVCENYSWQAPARGALAAFVEGTKGAGFSQRRFE